MPDYLKTIGDLAAASAGVITILSLMALLYKGASFIAGIPNRVRIYFFYKPRYILIPTPDELAKYCEKSFDSHRMTKNEEYEELSYLFVRIQRQFTATSRARVVILFHFFLCVFSLFGARLVYFGLMNEDLDRMSTAFIFLAALTWIHFVLLGSAFTFRKELGYRALFQTEMFGTFVKRFFSEDQK